jgi:hypothetical protein
MSSCRTPLCNCDGYRTDHVIAIPLANTRDAQAEMFKAIQSFQPGLHPELILSDIAFRISPEIMELMIRKKKNIWVSYIKPTDLQKSKIIWIPIWGETIVPSCAEGISPNWINITKIK